MLALNRPSFGWLPHSHRRAAGQQIHHHAFVGRVEMLDQDEGHAVACRQRLQKLRARIEATGRGANSDHREAAGMARPIRRGLRA
jgi:hypothetical protein